MMFMYAIGMKVGPQFFSGLARGGLDFVVIGLIVVFANFAIVVVGAKMLGYGTRLCRWHYLRQLYGYRGYRCRAIGCFIRRF